MTEPDEISEADLRRGWGEAVKAARIEAGMSQSALAAAVGIAQQNISAIENGEHSGSLLTQHRIARALTKKHADLFYDPRIPQETGS